MLTIVGDQHSMNLLIVDDSKTDVLIISSMLQNYPTYIAEDGIEALEQIRLHPEIDVMILDLNMPRMDGFTLLQTLNEHPEYPRVAALILTNNDEVEQEIRGLDLGALDYIRKPLNLQTLRKKIELHGNLIETRKRLEYQNVSLEKIVAERTIECNLTRDVTIQALVGLLEVRNIESSNHTRRTKFAMKALCEHLRTLDTYKDVLTDTYINELVSTAPLHDIGKVGIPDEILLKPGRLTPEEFNIMKRHTTYGVDALTRECTGDVILPFIQTAAEIAGTHHEKYDGTGYPNGLSGKLIPLGGRLMAIIDVYDALVSKRIYKPAYSHEQSVSMILSESGRHFDPDIVEVFVQNAHEFLAIHEQYH